MAALANLQEEFPGAITFVSLIPISDPDFVWPAVATALGIEDGSDALEDNMGVPVDIECAIANGELSLLRRRPVTAWPHDAHAARQKNSEVDRKSGPDTDDARSGF